MPAVNRSQTDDYLAVSRLLAAYSEASTRRVWDDFLPLATPDARFTFHVNAGDDIEIDGPADLGAFFAKMTAGFGFFEYTTVNFVVDFTSERTAEGRAWSMETAQMAGTGDVITFYGLYHDDYAKDDDGAWRFSRRRYQTLAVRAADGTMTSNPIVVPPDRAA